MKSKTKTEKQIANDPALYLRAAEILEAHSLARGVFAADVPDYNADVEIADQMMGHATRRAKAVPSWSKEARSFCVQGCLARARVELEMLPPEYDLSTKDIGAEFYLSDQAMLVMHGKVSVDMREMSEGKTHSLVGFNNRFATKEQMVQLLRLTAERLEAERA